MIPYVSLSVRFPKFGNNYYVQHVVPRKQAALITDADFDAVLMPSAANHFSNEIVGLNDQFRFLNDVLAAHLLDVESRQPVQNFF